MRRQTDTAASDNSLRALFPGLYATPTSPLPFLDEVVVRSFVLLTVQGPVIVYNSPGIDATSDQLMQLGPPHRLLLNHYHEAMYGPPQLKVPTYIHEHDRSGVESSMRIAGVFTTRQHLQSDLEVIPSFSHTAGTTFFLWDNGAHRFLFPGDAIWVEDGTWKAVILAESNRQAFLATITVLQDLDFDVLVPWHAHHDAQPYDVVTPRQKHDQLEQLSARIAAGAAGPRA
jgi:hypothetical protein